MHAEVDHVKSTTQRDKMSPAISLSRRAAPLLTSATYIPGIHIRTSPTDFYPIKQVQVARFTGERWKLFGPIIDGPEQGQPLRPAGSRLHDGCSASQGADHT